MHPPVKKIAEQFIHFVKAWFALTALCSVLLLLFSYWVESKLLLAVIQLSILSILVITVLVFGYRIKSNSRAKLDSISQLEQWADISEVCSEVQLLPKSNDSLTIAINKLLTQLHEAKNTDSHFDRTLRGNVLLDRQTGVGNREFFNNRLEALLKEEDIQGAVYFIHFNDCELVQTLYGEKQAVALLDALIENIKYCLKHLASYFIARRAEFELAVIIPGIFFTEAEKLAGKLAKSLITVPLPVGVNKEEFVHIGVSYFSQAENAYQVKSEADMALRSAQLQGPSQWFMYDPGEVEHASAKGSLKWRTFLTQAIEKNAFVIFFQPVVAKDGEQVLHHEVLAKVRDIDGTLISARVFLPMANKCGLSQTIDLLVFEQVCRLLTYDKNQHDTCSLNFSLESLLSRDFVTKVVKVLDNNKELATRLIVEISEYHLANHVEELKPVLNELHRLGIKLLADKVGQHIESAQYLKSCPINYMKLHRSIVLNIHHKPENQIFIQSLRTICDANRVHMYALGVESFDEWQILLRLGINGGQGHYFTEPVAQVAKAIHLH